MNLQQKNQIKVKWQTFEELIIWIIKLIGKLSEKRAKDLKCAPKSHGEM